MAHPNEDLLRRGYQAFAEGDQQALDELFHDDITWHAPGDTPFSGDFEGKAAVFGNFATLRERTEGFEQELHDVLANDDHAVALVRTRVTTNGETHEDVAVHVYHVEDGQVRSAWLHPYDQAGAADLWS